MNFERRQKKTISSVKLSTLKGGTVFHFANILFDNAIKEEAIYKVVSGGKDNRVQIVALIDGLLLQRDGCHNVCELNATLVFDE